ncbi:Tox-REase-5 domain-containing protein [Streptomyces sp. CA-278952]|uniref:Tox-REase-5 domain-containing protein n=1 Tax=Streptomyces sp. CA-278952 TaxID=2980556 RepID=UPI002368BD31|nr:Tox-REase-5 domain-containing protein [Streptomyces sp. CA-278952]WDG28456.1 Tox-REase-5 domain-containing protein [Streptomyces sp. CA-278952]
MSAVGGIPVAGGPAPAVAPRRELPRPLVLVRVLLLVLFGATLLGAIGLSGSALAADAMGAEVLGILLYASAPGVLAALLARHVRTGGTRVRWGIVAVQVWLILGGLANLGDGSPDGLTQLVLPILITVLISRAGSRAWFRLPSGERGQPPKFSLPHMITWKRDRGQTALEYLGLVLIVVALIGALTVGGLGGRITEGLQSAICSLTGSSCPVSPGSGSVEAGDRPGGGTGGGTDGAADGGADGGTDGGTDEGADGGSTTTGGVTGGSTEGATGGEGTGGTGGTGSTGGTEGSGGSEGSGGPEGSTTTGGGTGGPDDTGRPGTGEDTFPEDDEEPEAAHDVQASDDGEGEGEEGGEQAEEQEDCGGWGFFGCAWDRTTQVVKGLVVDGLWGDITGIIDLFKPETWSGLADYGKQLGDQWTKDSAGAGDKWADGDYLGALLDWGRASVGTVVTVGDDVFVGDEVRERWNNGEKTRAVTDVIWNIGSIFIPGYNVGKVVGKVGKLGALGKVAGAVARAADDAGAAARRARKAAEAGDLDGVRKAAKEADDAADTAEDAARRTGCAIASGPPRVRYGGGGATGVPGSGTGVLAGGSPDRIVAANGGCDEAAKAAAAQARAAERAAHLERKRLEEPERARKAEVDKKKYPQAQRNDTSDPRNYNPPSWADDLEDRTLGDADAGDGYWASRDRNPAPNWKNESWLRYQEQVTGTNRGQEYVVPHPREGKPAVEYDGWDSSRQTFLEAKNGYGSYLSTSGSGALTPSGKDKFVTEARAQVEASGGRSVEWHFSDPEVAKAARRAFRDEGLPVKVVHSPTKPNDSTRKPGAFDE